MTPPPSDQQSIRDAIAREESRFLRLEEDVTNAQAPLSWRAELDALATAVGRLQT